MKTALPVLLDAALGGVLALVEGMTRGNGLTFINPSNQPVRGQESVCLF